MSLELSPEALRYLQGKRTIEVDALTYQAMTEIASEAGGNIPELLSRLANKYRNCNSFEKRIVINFLNGV